MTPEMRMMEQQYVPVELVAIRKLTIQSFKVFDYTRAQRRSYYHPAPAAGQTVSRTTATTSDTAVSLPDRKQSSSPQSHMMSQIPTRPDSTRPGSPSERTGVISRTGLDVEAQILDGGGMANLGGRGGWRSSDIEPDGTRESVEMRSSPFPSRQETPLRISST